MQAVEILVLTKEEKEVPKMIALVMVNVVCCLCYNGEQVKCEILKQ